MAEDTKPTEPASSKLTPQDVTSVTKHTIRINGKALKYTVTCGTVVLREEHDKDGEALDARARASMFFIAYTLDGVRDQRGGRSLIRSMAGRVPARCGCIWGCWGRSG